MSHRAEKSRILHGAGKDIQAVPDDEFLQAMKHLPQHMEKRLAFMSREHHQVRDFVVREMPRQTRPITPLQIAQTTGLSARKVNAIVEDLERHLFFLVRDSAGAVSWAFPVTTARTPHRLSFSSGEKTFGA